MITLDEKKVEAKVDEVITEKVVERIKELEMDLIYWDSKELCRRCSMSWNTIQKLFFFDPRFPKIKVSGKWYFPAEDTKQFLIQWLREQKM